MLRSSHSLPSPITPDYRRSCATKRRTTKTIARSQDWHLDARALRRRLRGGGVPARLRLRGVATSSGRCTVRIHRRRVRTWWTARRSRYALPKTWGSRPRSGTTATFFFISFSDGPERRVVFGSSVLLVRRQDEPAMGRVGIGQ